MTFCVSSFDIRRRHSIVGGSLAVILAALALVSEAGAQLCPGTTLVSGLRRPLGLALSNLGNVIVSETGTEVPGSGRLSILDRAGARRTLLDGLPSALNDVAEPSGPAGLAMRGRTLYVLMGIGDTVLPAPVPTRHLPNPVPSSPIFSSVLAIHVSASVEQRTAGFVLSSADQQTLASGERVVLSNGGGDTIQLELVANFPDYVPDPIPGFPQIVRGSNPFSLVIVADQLYVTDGGRNVVWQVDRPSGQFSPLTSFGTIPNPLPIGGPVVEAVPTGIEYADGQLLVTLFRGVPFPPGTSVVVQVDPSSGTQTPIISGLKTAIAVIGVGSRDADDLLVLQHSSGQAPFFAGPGLLLLFESPGSAPATLANCLTRPTAMVLDERTGTVYVSEYLTGRVVAMKL